MAENQGNWYHLGPLLAEINDYQPTPLYLYFNPMNPDILKECFFDDQLYNALFNGGQGKLNAIYEYTSNKHLGVDEDDYDNDVVTIQYSPINLSFQFCYKLDNDGCYLDEPFLYMFHTGEPTRFMTHENAHLLMNDTNLPNKFSNWLDFLEKSTPCYASLIIGPFNGGFKSKLTSEIDTDLYFRWVEKTEPENQTQERELHIRVIQERFPFLKPVYDEEDELEVSMRDAAISIINRSQDPLAWIFLGYNTVPNGLFPRQVAIPFAYTGDYLREFLNSFPNGRMKERINGGLAIRVPNVYCKRNNSTEWTVLTGVQIKMLLDHEPKTLILMAPQISECDFYMLPELQIETCYRWRNGYLEFRIEFAGVWNFPRSESLTCKPIESYY
ncbi:unnamed protein product [Amaranthus hypochondriacus]